MSLKKDRGDHPEIGVGRPRGKHLRPTDLWIDLDVGNSLVEGFCYGGILFMSLVDLN